MSDFSQQCNVRAIWAPLYERVLTILGSDGLILPM